MAAVAVGAWAAGLPELCVARRWLLRLGATKAVAPSAATPKAAWAKREVDYSLGPGRSSSKPFLKGKWMEIEGNKAEFLGARVRWIQLSERLVNGGTGALG